VTTVNGSNSVTVASATGLAVGQTVTSTNIPKDSVISNIAGNTLTLVNSYSGAAANATASAAGTALTVSGTLVDTTYLNGTNGFRIDGTAVNQEFCGTSNVVGTTTVATGDVNSDSVTDAVFGSFNSTGAYTDNGSAYVLFGGTGLFSATTVSTTNGSSSATVASASGLVVGETVSSSNIPSYPFTGRA
jgi:hypothetical protein